MNPVLVVNVDVAFLTNLVTDWAWLWATAVLAGLRPARWRLGLAAGVGGLLAVWACFPSGRWLVSGPGVLLGTAGLVGLAFLPCRPRQAMRAALYFLLCGGAMAGGVLLAGALTAGRAVAGSAAAAAAGAGVPHGQGLGPFSGTLVASGLLVTLAGARWLWEAARERSRLARGVYTLRLRVGEGWAELPALTDTGNSLREPLLGTPVVVADTAALASLLPASARAAAAAGWAGLDQLSPDWSARCRMVPYRAVGRTGGALLAIMPDEILVRAPGQKGWTVVHGLIALAPEPLHPEGAYRALLPPALFDAVGGPTAWEGEFE